MSLGYYDYLLRLSSSRAFGHIGQQLGAILNGQLQHIQPTPTWSRPSANPAGKFCTTSFWGVLFHACHPLESRILPLSLLDDLVSVVWPAIGNLRSVIMSDSFLELAQSKIFSFVMWSLYVTFIIFLKHRWWKKRLTYVQSSQSSSMSHWRSLRQTPRCYCTAIWWLPVINSAKRKVGGLEWNADLNRLVAENGRRTLAIMLICDDSL